MKLIECLRDLDYGRVILRLIRAMCKSINNILNSAAMYASIEICQGAPSSCLLFVLYIDKMEMLKRNVATDGYLGNLHTTNDEQYYNTGC